jgi:hypothetical protein
MQHNLSQDTTSTAQDCIGSQIYSSAEGQHKVDSLQKSTKNSSVLYSAQDYSLAIPQHREILKAETILYSVKLLANIESAADPFLIRIK